ncbi:hypothetical protein HNO88_003033 [Novosphingobium chloroacetimidivorans]|uniref:Uncharacterized protein n=1 Tax=Novosphingobium chloroacetimidivorans TaxID=1428314 RepID=A0A7W7KCE3_9SPHN|nr:hypothetical protein [Novosphingobium chloroacetimidivorans]
MKAALRDFEPLIDACSRYAINQTIGLADATRPPTFPFTLERLGLPGSPKRIAAALLDQGIQFAKSIGIMIQPMPIVVPSRIVEDDLHG